MKNLLLSTLALFLFGNVAFSQISGGLKAGANFASTKFEVQGESEKYSGTNFHAGVYVNVALSEALSLQPELLYNSLKVDTDGEDLTSNYLSIPVMLVYGFMDNKINVQAGPQLGLLLSTDPSEFKDNDGFTATDFTFNLGAGVNLGKFNATLRYGIGLANITGDGLSGLDATIKNNNLQLSVGYRLFGGE